MHDKWTQELLQNKDSYMGYFETEVQLRDFFKGVRNFKDFYNTKNAICTLIGEFDIRYIIKQKLIEEQKISEKCISMDEIKRYYKTPNSEEQKTIKKILSVFED